MPSPKRATRAPKLNFAITDENIAAATPRNSGHCMIADALADAMPEARFISVDLATIRWTDINAGWRYIYLTPRPAQEALLAFDQGDHVQPFRVLARAAQMIPTGSARKARKDLDDETPAIELVKDGGGGNVPIKVGGEAPAIGTLGGIGVVSRRDRSTGSRVNSRGKRREYGLRVYQR